MSYQPLFTVALAGVESCHHNFNQQGALIYDLREPSKWERSGNISSSLVFPIQQHLFFKRFMERCGVLTQQVSLSLSMATQRVSGPYGCEPGPLYLNHGLIGWPESIGENWTIRKGFPLEAP